MKKIILILLSIALISVALYLTKPISPTKNTTALEVENISTNQTNESKTDSPIEFGKNKKLNTENPPKKPSAFDPTLQNVANTSEYRDKSLQDIKPKPWPNSKDVDQLNNHFYQQEYDSEWASAKEVSIQSTLSTVFSEYSLPNQVQKIECRSLSCRLEFHEDLDNDLFNSVIEKLYETNEKTQLIKSLSLRKTIDGRTLIFVSRHYYQHQ